MAEQATIKVSQLDKISIIKPLAKFLMTQDSKSYAVEYSSLQYKLSNDFDIVGINRRIQTNTTSVNDLNTTVIQHATKINNLTTASTTYDENIQTISGNVNSHSARIDAAEANINEISGNVNNLSGDISHISSIIDNDLSVVATNEKLGLVKCGYQTQADNRNYAVSTDQDGNMYVNVPWSGGSGGSDPAVNVLKSISSYYAGPGANPLNKVEELSIDFTRVSSYVEELSDMDIAGRVERCVERLDEIVTFDDSGEMLNGFIVDLSTSISALYPVGAVYTTTNDRVPDELTANGRSWSEINTDLSSLGIKFFQRTK